jgi:cysteine desulfurase
MTLPNILNFSFDKNLVEFDDEMLLIQLDLKGIAVSGGSACTSGTHKPSHVLLALGYDAKSALGAIRVSFGRENTLDDVEKFVIALKEIVRAK